MLHDSILKARWTLHQTFQYDKRHILPCSLIPGKFVPLSSGSIKRKTQNKLSPLWLGPFPVKSLQPPLNVDPSLPNAWRTYLSSRLMTLPWFHSMPEHLQNSLSIEVSFPHNLAWLFTLWIHLGATAVRRLTVYARTFSITSPSWVTWRADVSEPIGRKPTSLSWLRFWYTSIDVIHSFPLL